MSEYYFQCSFYNFRQIVGRTIPNQKGEYLLECGHLYSLYPGQGQHRNNFYVHLYISPVCQESNHVQKITANLRYQLQEPNLTLTPYPRSDPKTEARHQLQKNQPFVTWSEPMTTTGPQLAQLTFDLLMASEEVIELKWGKNYFPAPNRGPITYYMHLTTELAEFQITLKNFWSGQVQDLEKTLVKKKKFETEPFKYLKRVPPQLIKLKDSDDQLEIKLIKKYLGPYLHQLVIPIICDYYRMSQQDEALPYPRNSEQTWSL